ncbi:MAG: gamma carbonic anhydrase family protein [Eubacterium sp.]|nr:gamma carbonic anhydrase family protein [Eubacterium sp.]
MNKSVKVAESAVIRGDVEIGENCTIWHNATIRGDMAPIRIGKETNIQDNAVVHVDYGYPTDIGDGVTVGHSAIVHGCTVGDNTLIGMGAIVLNGAKIGKDCIIGAGALVTQNSQIPDGSLAFGNPAKVVRPLKPEEIQSNRDNAIAYIKEGEDM